MNSFDFSTNEAFTTHIFESVTHIATNSSNQFLLDFKKKDLDFVRVPASGGRTYTLVSLPIDKIGIVTDIKENSLRIANHQMKYSIVTNKKKTILYLQNSHNNGSSFTM